MQRAAILASGMPVALDTNGTVREARGFTSSRKMVSSPSSLVWMANWVFISPTTFSALASSTTCLRSSAWVFAESEYGGSEHDESPECTPASSMCSMTPPISTAPVPSAMHVDIDFHGVVEESIEQHRRIVGDLDRIAHVARQVGFAVARFPWRGRRARRTDAPPADSRSRAPAPALPRRCGRCGWAAASGRVSRPVAGIARDPRPGRWIRAKCR